MLDILDDASFKRTDYCAIKIYSDSSGEVTGNNGQRLFDFNSLEEAADKLVQITQ